MSELDNIEKLLNEIDLPTHMIARDLESAMMVHELFGSEIVMLRDGKIVGTVPAKDGR